MEKKKRKARERAAWQASMAEVGRYEYLSVTADNDIRLKARGEPAKEWTDEEIWDFITLNGAAVDPRRVKGLVRVRPCSWIVKLIAARVAVTGASYEHPWSFAMAPVTEQRLSQSKGWYLCVNNQLRGAAKYQHLFARLRRWKIQLHGQTSWSRVGATSRAQRTS